MFGEHTNINLQQLIDLSVETLSIPGAINVIDNYAQKLKYTDIKSAIALYLTAKEYFDKANVGILIKQPIYLGLISCYLRNGEEENSQQIIDELLSAVKELQDTIHLVKVNTALGQSCDTCEKYAEAERFYLQAIEYSSDREESFTIKRLLCETYIEFIKKLLKRKENNQTHLIIKKLNKTISEITPDELLLLEYTNLFNAFSEPEVINEIRHNIFQLTESLDNKEYLVIIFLYMACYFAAKNNWHGVNESQQKIVSITEEQAWEKFITHNTYQHFINATLQLALAYYQKGGLKEGANLLRKAINVHLQFSEFNITASVLREAYAFLRDPYENQIHAIEFRLYNLAVNILGGEVDYIYNFNDLAIIYEEIVENIASPNATKYQMLANDLKLIMQYLIRDLDNPQKQLPPSDITLSLEQPGAALLLRKWFAALNNISAALLQLTSHHSNTIVALANQVVTQGKQITDIMKQDTLNKARIQKLEDENTQLKSLLSSTDDTGHITFSRENKKRKQTVLTEFFSINREFNKPSPVPVFHQTTSEIDPPGQK